MPRNGATNADGRPIGPRCPVLVHSAEMGAPPRPLTSLLPVEEAVTTQTGSLVRPHRRARDLCDRQRPIGVECPETGQPMPMGDPSALAAPSFVHSAGMGAPPRPLTSLLPVEEAVTT